MSTFVVDASVAAKWFVEEEHADSALSVLSERNQLHVPDFFFLEMDNVFCKWIRRGIISATDGADLREAVRRQPVRQHPFALLLDSAFAMANQTGCGLYDCLYVALAVLLDGRMVTADRRLYDGLAGGPFAEHVAWVENVGLHEDGGREDER